MSVITVQAGYGHLVIDDQPDEARASLAAIEAAGRQTLAEAVAGSRVRGLGQAAADGASGMTVRVLIAEDQALVRAGLKGIVGTAPDLLVVGEAATGSAAVELDRVQLVILAFRTGLVSGDGPELAQ